MLSRLYEEDILTLYYRPDPLQPTLPKSRQTKPQSCVDKLPQYGGKTSENSQITQDDLDQLADYVLNGRQIKNIISCTVSLSRLNNKAITVEKIQRMVKVLCHVDSK